MRKPLLLLCLLAAYYTASAQLPSFKLDRVVGTPVDFPQDIKVSRSGVVHVLDRMGVEKLDATGRHLQTIRVHSTLASSNAYTPVDYISLALDGQDNIYLVNKAASFVRKYNAAGDSLLQIGTPGTAPGQFTQPEGATVDAAGNIYVADTGNNRVQKLSPTGQVQWVYAPAAPAALTRPADVKLAPDGSVYVLCKNFTAVKLTVGGQLLSTLSLRYPGALSYDETTGLGIDAAGTLYLVSSRMTAVQHFDAQGAYLGPLGPTPNTFSYRSGIGLDAAGNLYVTDGTDRDPSMSSIRKMSPSGAVLQQWSNQPQFGMRMRQDEAGNLYYTDYSVQRIVKLNAAGQQVATIGGPGTADGQFGTLAGVAVDAQGNVYSLESYTFPARIQKFDAQGRFLAKFPIPDPQNNSNGYQPCDLTIDAAGNMYVLDYWAGVRKYNSQGRLLQSIGSHGSGSGPGPGQFYAPRGVVVDYRGNIYVSDGAGHRVQKFNAAGQLLREYVSIFRPTFMGSPSLSAYDAGLAVDGAGNIYASIGVNDYVTMFEANTNRQVKLPTRADLITVNQSGTQLICTNLGTNALRYYVPANKRPRNLISGKVFQDLNNDCVQQANEPGLPDVLVTAAPGDYYGLSDANGAYTLSVDTGTYVVQQALTPTVPGRSVQQLCSSGNATATFSSYGNSVNGPDFGDLVSQAPYLSVHVASTRRRRCFRNVTTVSYANTGFATAPNATVTVALPPQVLFIRADVPHTRDAAGNYVFAVGALQPNQRGQITIQDSVACGDPTIRGLTVCTRAWIRPVNSFTAPMGWNRASMAVSGTLQLGNQVRFAVTNRGTGATTDSLGLRIYQDAQLALTRRIALAAGDSVVLRWTPTGPAVRVEVDQPQGHPYGPMASAMVEVPGLRSSSGPVAAMMAMPAPNQGPEIVEDCQPILDSYDPNDKQVAPVGTTAQHYTPTNTPLRYQIRFQNTGNDVAYRVAVTDTLAADLDIRTLEVGAVSHPYRMTVSGQGRPVLTFTFDNILLPDSTHDPVRSNGFVQFSIRPKAGLPARTRIDNNADIVFDYNAPVRTNTTTNRIYDVPAVVVPAVALSYPAVLASPTVATVSPGQGRFGTLVTITGQRFAPVAADNRVVFNGVAAPVLSASATSLTVRVPAGATSGPLALSTRDGAARSSTPFTVYQPPVLTALSPYEGRPGATVTLTGSYFSALAAEDTVKFNGVPARVLQASAGGLQVEVPAGATKGKVSIWTLGGRTESAQDFMVWYPPTVSSIAPARARAGATLTLTGANFAEVATRNTVTFAGGQTAPVVQSTASSLQVRVPAGAQSGFVQVQTPGGQGGSPLFTFIPAPVISAFTPAQGTVGSVVTITGQHFNEEGLADTIYVNGVAAQVLRRTSTSAEIVVPRGASTGQLSTAGAGGRGASATAFSVTALPPAEAVTVYPNPTRGDVTVSWRQADFVVQRVRVYNAVGSLIIDQTITTTDEAVLPLARSRAGLYVVVIQTPHGQVVKRITLL